MTNALTKRKTQIVFALNFLCLYSVYAFYCSTAFYVYVFLCVRCFSLKQIACKRNQLAFNISLAVLLHNNKHTTDSPFNERDKEHEIKYPGIVITN